MFATVSSAARLADKARRALSAGLARAAEAMAAPGAPPGGAAPNTPMQISPEWWMAYSPEGHPYYHNTATKETTWTRPNVSSPTAPAAPPQNDSKALDQQALQSYLLSNQVAEAQAQAQANQGAQAMGYNSASMGNQSVPRQSTGHSVSPMGQQSLAPMGDMGGSMGSRPVQTVAAAGGTEPEITCKGNGHIPSPWRTFNDVQLPRPFIEPMLQAGFQAPTPIQATAWPILASGRDVVGIAKTGSGKTLGFLLPVVNRMLQERMSGSPIMLVMAPTRELAVQIDAEAKKFGGIAGVVTALAYGGAPKGPQLNDIRRRPHLLTGTPGRLNDFLEARMISLGDVRFLCLDEADRMLDMGFEPQIRKVIACIPPRRQTMMFTATWPKEVRRLASDFFQDPIEVRIGNVDELQANADIEQRVIICSNPREKESRLFEILQHHSHGGQTIVFTGTDRKSVV